VRNLTKNGAHLTTILYTGIISKQIQLTALQLK